MLRVVDHGLEPWLCQTKDYKDMSEWSDMSSIFVYMWIEVSEHYKDPI